MRPSKLIGSITIYFGLITGDAWGRCPQPNSFISDNASSVAAKYIDYLICMNNEQRDAINKLNGRVSELETKLETIANEHLFDMRAMHQRVYANETHTH